MAIRRRWADSRRGTFASTWPIDPAAVAAPCNWPGWPKGRQFSLVLTHDVESARGAQKIREVIDIEKRLGFRSAFNLVPDGGYAVPESLREGIQANGFEVGVHGLQHDGRLYSSRRKFAEKAAVINTCIENWRACGFRSPLMQHRLSWLHKLDIQYDCSTFDTDPFELEPDGVRTIFPFWVPGPDGDGFVELPYTLPQDFTLFVVLREKNIDIWKRKLDWVAAHGGMALVNTHPDYMAFDGRPARDEYPVAFYEELLSYIREKYDGAYWSALPRDVARYYTSSLPPEKRNTRRKVCMLAYAYYKSDNRVRRYAETLAARGDQVEVIGLSHGDEPLDEEQIRGVTSYRIQRRNRDEGTKWAYAWRLARFLLSSSLFLARRHNQVRYDVIHVHNVPDTLVFAAVYPKWTGAKLILDIHDIVPELFANKSPARASGVYYSLLKLCEKISARFADHVIVSNHLWHDKLIARSAPAEKCSVFLNHVDPAIFYPHPRTRTDGRFVIVFPGTFQWHQGLDIAIRALARLHSRVPDAELHLYGGGNRQSELALASLSRELGIADCVKFFPHVPLDKVPEIIANADLGVVPKRADSFGDEAYSTKIMEFMSQGVPVVVSRTRIDTFYFDESVVHFFPSGDDQALADAMLDVIEDPTRRSAMVDSAFEYVKRNGWDQKKSAYVSLVDTLSTENFDAYNQVRELGTAKPARANVRSTRSD